jgi:hypothetical protein
LISPYYTQYHASIPESANGSALSDRGMLLP